MAITVLSEYGAKSAPDHLGAFVDKNAQELVARKLLSELARAAAKDMKSPAGRKGETPAKR